MNVSTDLNPSLPAVAEPSAPPLADAESRPKHQRLRELIVDEISSGRLKPGEALPTERWWAERHDLARSTVRQAMAALERDGLIRRVQGKGTFVHENARERLRRRLDVFALLLPETQAGLYPSLQRSFDEAAAEVHHQLLVCNTLNNVDRQGNAILQLMDKQVAGVALVPVTQPATPAYQVRQLRKAGIPLVYCHRRVEGVSAPWLAIPFWELGRMVGRALVERGHRRAAFFSHLRTESGLAYLDGLRAGLAEGQAHAPDEFVFFGPDGLLHPSECETEIAAALATMLAREDRPTAIFASFDSVAELIFLLLSRYGIRVPDDVSLVGMGGLARTTPLMRQLTSATVDEVLLGRRAAELLDQMRRGELPLDDGTIHTATIGLSDGQTLGRAPATTRGLTRVDGPALVHAQTP